MSKGLIGAIFALGILAIALAFVVPALIDTPDTDYEASVELDINDTEDFRDVVRLQLDAVNSTADSVNVTVIDIDSLNQALVTELNATESTTVTPGTEAITVTHDRVEDADTAVLTVAFSRTYNWTPAAQVFIDNLDTILTIISLVVILSFLFIPGGRP